MNRHHVWLRFALLIGLLTPFLGGCGGDDRKALYPTRGRVIDATGQPLGGATVLLHPVDTPNDNRHKPGGNADTQGVFVLTTYTENDGAPAGDYVATVVWKPAPKGPGDDPPDQLKGKFRDPKTSPFKVTVKAGDNELPPIQIP